MGAVLHIVAGCAQTKALPVPDSLQLRSIAAHPVGNRVARWVKQRDATVVPRQLTARDLYSGTYWATVRRVFETARSLGYDARLWVASAGYGLVPAEESLSPYSATFAAGTPDSVCPPGAARQARIDALGAWWSGLCAARPSGLARSLGKGDPSVMVLAGPAYITAMQDDLLTWAGTLKDSRRLVVVTSEARVAPEIASNVIPSEARFIHKLGGSLPLLHARVAEHLILESRGRPLNAHDLRSYAEAILDAQPAWQMPERDKSTDRQVTSFIRARLRDVPALSYTAALRAYRAQGQACEQKRFRALFATIVGATHGA